MGGANGSRECAPDDKLRDTNRLHVMEMMGFAGFNLFTRSTRSPDAAQRHQRVHARLRRAMTCGVVRC